MHPRDALAIDAARLYYERGQSQAEVAASLRVSRPTVSKLIQHAKDRGFVRIEIDDPRERDAALADAVRGAFGLREVRLVRSHDEPGDLLAALGAGGARLVEEEVGDGDLVGVAWGATMSALAARLQRQPSRHGVEIVALQGGSPFPARPAPDAGTIGAFCAAFDAPAHLLPLPAVFDDPRVKALVEGERHIRHVLDLARSAPVAVVTVGAAHPEAMPFAFGSVTPRERAALLRDAAGEICSRFYDDEGRVALPELDARTVGISLPDLTAKRTRIVVAGGRATLRPLAAALRAGYATHLVTDTLTAHGVLDGVLDRVPAPPA